MATVAHELVRTLSRLGVDHVFLNPGTDTAPVQEAVLALAAAGEKPPQIVLCPHETVALAAAQSFYALTGRVQLVMVHVDVGTQNLGSMVHNVARANAGVVIIAGRTPVTANGELVGGRDSVVHWMQDVPDQAGVVRSYAKAATDLAVPGTVERQVLRAFQLAGSSPAGPVYLTAGRELLMQEAPHSPMLSVERYAPVSAPAPAPDAVARAAALLARAERPVFVSARVGVEPRTVADFTALVELLGARVVDLHDRVNFPTDHPQYIRPTEHARAAVREADVLVALECPVPWVPNVNAPASDAKVISIDEDPIRASVPGWSFPVDVNLHAGARLGIAALREALAAYADGCGEAWRGRRAALVAEAADDAEPPAATALDTVALGRALNEVLDQRDIVLEEITTNNEVLRTCLRRTVPGTYFRSGGSGLGFALGGALGAKLAAGDRRVVTLVGDGAFLFGAPTAALWALKLAQAPVLVVVVQNGGYAASRAPVFQLFPDGESARRREVLGTLFDGGPDYALIAEACGGWGAHVRDAASLVPTLRTAVERVDAGQCALVVVPVPSRWM